MRQETLAGRANLSRESLSRIENGKAEAGIRTLHDLAQALGVKLSDLMANVD